MYDIWTQPSINYTVFEDTDPPSSGNVTDGLFLVGNRYLAAAREVYRLIQRANATHNLSYYTPGDSPYQLG